MGKVDPHILGYKKFPKELKLHIAYLQLDTNESSMTWLDHAYLLLSSPVIGAWLGVKRISYCFEHQEIESLCF